MTTWILDGGPAFPHQPCGRDGLPVDEMREGMSLRDAAALAALPEAVADYDRVDRGPHKGNPILPYAAQAIGTREEIIARQAYRYADAMLKAREEG